MVIRCWMHECKYNSTHEISSMGNCVREEVEIDCEGQCDDFFSIYKKTDGYETIEQQRKAYRET